MIHKSNKAYKSIGEVAKILNLVNEKKGTLNTHTIRFWEKEFKQIRPILLSGNRRYYDEKEIEKIKYIKFLLKDKGYTLKGAKKLLKLKQNNVDDLEANAVRNEFLKRNIKKKTKLILDKIKAIKKNG